MHEKLFLPLDANCFTPISKYGLHIYSKIGIPVFAAIPFPSFVVIVYLHFIGWLNSFDKVVIPNLIDKPTMQKENQIFFRNQHLV